MSKNPIASHIMFIIYVQDQERSAAFYQKVLNMEPCLNVPGMTEFTLGGHVKLGIMPGDGIVRILNNEIRNPNDNIDIPRCEIYLKVDDPNLYYEHAVKLGGHGISKGELRNWGDYVAYCSDYDGNVIAFARTMNE